MPRHLLSSASDSDKDMVPTRMALTDYCVGLPQIESRDTNLDCGGSLRQRRDLGSDTTRSEQDLLLIRYKSPKMISYKNPK